MVAGEWYRGKRLALDRLYRNMVTGRKICFSVLLLVSCTVTTATWYHLTSSSTGPHVGVRQEEIVDHKEHRADVQDFQPTRKSVERSSTLAVPADDTLPDSLNFSDSSSTRRRMSAISKLTESTSLFINELILTYKSKRITPVPVAKLLGEIRTVEWKPTEKQFPTTAAEHPLVQGSGEGAADNNTTQVSTMNSSTVGITDRFRIREPCSLPQKYASKPLGVLLCHPWMQELKDFLGGLNSTLVSLVSSDYNYREVLLNWLISAMVKVSPPLSNVLVLSLDESLYKLLSSRGIACIHIPPESLIRVRLNSSLKRTGFRQVHIMRLTVMRLINHWGYDVANYDTDAIILKNPEPLYDRYADVDFIGSYGNFPQELASKWGIAVCIGVVLVRGTQQSEAYWEKMSTVIPSSTDDQARLNYALKAMQVTWKGTFSINLIERLGLGVNGFSAVVLPTRIFCRTKSCLRKNLQEYYVWHQGGDGRDKRTSALHNSVWYLKNDWEEVSNGTVAAGRDWLGEIARPVSTSVPSTKKKKKPSRRKN